MYPLKLAMSAAFSPFTFLSTLRPLATCVHGAGFVLPRLAPEDDAPGPWNDEELPKKGRFSKTCS